MAIQDKDIRDLATAIVREFDPEQVILFGSQAYGQPDESSDIDLLVVMPFEGSGARKAVEIMQTINPRIPIDLVVHTPEELGRRLALNDFFLKEIIEKGTVLYESAHA